MKKSILVVVLGMLSLPISVFACGVSHDIALSCSGKVEVCIGIDGGEATLKKQDKVFNQLEARWVQFRHPFAASYASLNLYDKGGKRLGSLLQRVPKEGGTDTVLSFIFGEGAKADKHHCKTNVLQWETISSTMGCDWEDRGNVGCLNKGAAALYKGENVFNMKYNLTPLPQIIKGGLGGVEDSKSVSVEKDRSVVLVESSIVEDSDIILDKTGKQGEVSVEWSEAKKEEAGGGM